MTPSPPAVEARAVYAHAPFCARRCTYCDFAVTVRRVGSASEWVKALGVELDAVLAEGLFTLASELDTLYVGGGTPSLLGPHAMHALAGTLGPARLRADELEWTVEANPESFTDEVAHGWAEAGVNRVSLGAQTFHEGALRWMGRLHGPDGPARAVRRARDVGIDTVSVDLIFGLPARLGRSWRDDLRRVLDLDVPHVSLYGLTVEPATPLGRAVSEGRESPGDDGQYAREFLTAHELLSAAGYRHYEVSSFARPGRESRHNQVYWWGAPYLGLGNGAHSYAPPVRRWNVRDWETYLERLRSGEAAEEGREVIDAAAGRLERIWLGLRTAKGIVIHPDREAALELAGVWEREGLATSTGDKVRLTPRGWLVLDRLAVDLERALDAA
jgi:oxygen-independent coproporphyrinogen-3 oxidase